MTGWSREPAGTDTKVWAHGDSFLSGSRLYIIAVF